MLILGGFTMTVIEYVLLRLKELGITDIFGVPGDYAFPIEDAICADPQLRWIGNCNELNAAYAADGYARIHGMAALTTTFGVGELSALNGIAGSYAEYLPVFHLVGMPDSSTQRAGRLVHHTLGEAGFNIFRQISVPVVCADTILTPENCIRETSRIISTALRERRPVYVGIPSDYANQLIIDDGTTVTYGGLLSSDPAMLKKATESIIARINQSQQICLLPGMLLHRFSLTDRVLKLVERTGLPFASMIMDKGILNETLPEYLGIYCGSLMNEHVREYVESCDCVIRVGALWSESNTGNFTAQLKEGAEINIMPNYVCIGETLYSSVQIGDLLDELIKMLPVRLQSRTGNIVFDNLFMNMTPPQGAITAEYLYHRWQRMLKPYDILITETGNSAMGMAFMDIPEGVTFLHQPLWGAIGWATPAAFGAAVASPSRRLILITGEGSHQLTAQEISQFFRYGLHPIIFVLNNDGYLIERQLCQDPEAHYNDLSHWNYTLLPQALGCSDWFTARVSTCQDLHISILQAEKCGTGAYIEVITGRYIGSQLGNKLMKNAKRK
ncbi:alpha-keto acid decarboxylase family protein [Salmonella enterica]|nr:alpha-keto acid decarboxylase family protein [Salmonella enterica]EBQ9004543.1 indole-3-pyruvate decarboxylase [Salmonella enterica subsp. enterica serovar Blockley]ECW2126436.1 alpha-keto acid decarboxylase family protein [Salmonella enterica]